ncbi:MAG TPA: sensor histidine kinase [Gemmatimonadaceae bacterium]|nr:sensor histidine kinase [Gemmatimonadaceae bacterium]
MRDTHYIRGVHQIVPLFAHNRRLWLRLWVGTQAAALIIASYAAGSSSRVATVVVLLVAYHVIGFTAYDWILRRRWAVLVYVPIGWALVSAAIGENGAFAVLAFGIVVQAFVFLPFAWAALALGVVLALFMLSVGLRVHHGMAGAPLIQIGAIGAVGVMVGTIVLYIHSANREASIRADLLRRLDAAARDAGMREERERLSREIHDTLAQALASVLRHLETIELELGNLDAGPRDRLMRHLAQAQSVSRDSMAEIRRLVQALRPAELAVTPLASAIERTVKRWADANGVLADVSLTEMPPLHPDADVVLLRAVQESLSNVARHAAARNVRVVLGRVDELVLLTVEDDGRGFDENDAQSREQLGITGMRERVRRFGGHVLIDSKPGAGTSLTIAIPAVAVAGSP